MSREEAQHRFKADKALGGYHMDSINKSRKRIKRNDDFRPFETIEYYGDKKFMVINRKAEVTAQRALEISSDGWKIENIYVNYTEEVFHYVYIKK